MIDFDQRTTKETIVECLLHISPAEGEILWFRILHGLTELFASSEYQNKRCQLHIQLGIGSPGREQQSRFLDRKTRDGENTVLDCRRLISIAGKHSKQDI